MKYFNSFILFAVILLILVSCKKEDETSQTTQKEIADSLSLLQTLEANKISFSGLKWFVKDYEPEFNSINIPSHSSNVRVDSLGKLHLKMSYIDGNFYGAEIEIDSLLDYGEFIFFLETKISSFPANCELLLRCCNPNEQNFSELTETGIAIGNENSKNISPIKYYAYNPQSKMPEKHYVNAKIEDETYGSIHKIILVNEAVTFISFSASDNKENPRNGAKLIYEYTFSKFNKNDLTFFTPNRKQKLIISLNCFDENQKTEEFEVVFSKIICKSTKTGATDVAAK